MYEHHKWACIHSTFFLIEPSASSSSFFEKHEGCARVRGWVLTTRILHSIAMAFLVSGLFIWLVELGFSLFLHQWEVITSFARCDLGFGLGWIGLVGPDWIHAWGYPPFFFFSVPPSMWISRNGVRCGRNANIYLWIKGQDGLFAWFS